MNVMSNFGSIPGPARDQLDFSYDADCKNALEPHLSELLGAAESAGWERGRAAAALMFLAAQQLTDATSALD